MINISSVSAAISAAVLAVVDPELGDVTIGDLGMVRSVNVDDDLDGRVRVVLTPTFLGCPAARLIASAVDVAARTAGARWVEVVWDPTPWSETQVTAQGRHKLARLGIAVGDDGKCPHCDAELVVVAANSAASCRSMARCTNCGDLVDVLRGAASPIRWRHYAHL